MKSWQKEYFKSILLNTDTPPEVPTAGVVGYNIGKLIGNLTKGIGIAIDHIPVISDVRAGFQLGMQEVYMDEPEQELKEVAEKGIIQALQTYANTLNEEIKFREQT